MTESTKAKVKAAREARLRAALRENLKRRKAQARGRNEADEEPGKGEPVHPAASSDTEEGR
jgi:hypothetical protein